MLCYSGQSALFRFFWNVKLSKGFSAENWKKCPPVTIVQFIVLITFVYLVWTWLFQVQSQTPRTSAWETRKNVRIWYFGGNRSQLYIMPLWSVFHYWVAYVRKRSLFTTLNQNSNNLSDSITGQKPLFSIIVQNHSLGLTFKNWPYIRAWKKEQPL